MKGIPLRIEIGPRDLANNKAVLVRRDTGIKSIVSSSDIAGESKKILEDIQLNLWSMASKRLQDQTAEVRSDSE